MPKEGIVLNLGGSLNSGDISYESLISRYGEKCKAAAGRLNASASSDSGLGWMFIDNNKLDEIKSISEKLKNFDSVIQIGIGGSALGNLMLNEIFLGNFPNEVRSQGPRFYLADNPDPQKISDIWDIVKNGTVALVVVSKSGSTAETMSQFIWFSDKLSQKGEDLSKCVFVITDAEKGILRPFVNETGCESLVVPSTVGGRYSVLSPVGLLAAAALGIDIDSLVTGAVKMRDWLFSHETFEANPVWQLASLSMYHASAGRPMTVLMPYSSRMAYFTEWFAQLWGESLGKNGKGTTPIRAVGAIDQHSQIQLYTEGPDDKFFMILDVKDRGSSVVIPESKVESLKDLSYMYNANISDMLSFEALSTASAIRKADKPVVFIEVEKLTAETVGKLIFFFEYLTAFVGYMMEINPFDQPGVEQGKNYTYSLMNRRGYGESRKEVERYFSEIKELSCKF